MQGVSSSASVATQRFSVGTYFWICTGLTVLSLVCQFVLRHSRFGRRLRRADGGAESAEATEEGEEGRPMTEDQVSSYRDDAENGRLSLEETVNDLERCFLARFSRIPPLADEAARVHPVWRGVPVPPHPLRQAVRLSEEQVLEMVNRYLVARHRGQAMWTPSSVGWERLRDRIGLGGGWCSYYDRVDFMVVASTEDESLAGGLDTEMSEHGSMDDLVNQGGAGDDYGTTIKLLDPTSLSQPGPALPQPSASTSSSPSGPDGSAIVEGHMVSVNWGGDESRYATMPMTMHSKRVSRLVLMSCASCPLLAPAVCCT